MCLLIRVFSTVNKFDTSNTMTTLWVVFTLLVFVLVNDGTAEHEEYDYIVVGAGSAGAVLTNRLSAKYRVLLLEKGGTPSIITEVPGLIPVMYFTRNADKYFAEKQPGVGLGLKNQQVSWLRGKGLGATSLINYMMYVRGQKADYDRWAAAGNPGWSFKDIVRSFKRFEKVEIPHINTTLRGLNGEMDINELPYRSKIAKAFYKGCKQAGMNQLQDYNDGASLGVGYLQSNIRNGRRCHSEKSFLHDIRHRKTLTIKTGALVTKLRINKKTKSVLGVEYKIFGRPHYAKATKEVILSAGAFGSPQILMLSGIGPKTHLQEFDIEVVKDLPVGQVIYDHISYPALIFKLNASVSPMLTDLLNPINWGRFLLKGTGPLTLPALVVEAVSLVKTKVSNDTLPLPDIELIFASGSFNTDYGLFFKHEFNIDDEAYNAIWGPLKLSHVWMLVPMLYHPQSRGYMKLRSKDASDRPKFYGNYFTDPGNKDMRTIIASIRIAQQIAKTPALAKYSSKLRLEPVPGCRKEVVDSDAFWECQLRHLALSLWHQVGSCKMGPRTDPEAVVDNKLRVYGIKNLRVADTSIIPRPLSVHTNAPSTMVGQRASEIILEDR